MAQGDARIMKTFLYPSLLQVHHGPHQIWHHLKFLNLKKEKVELKSSFKWSFKQLCYPTESANNINANDGTQVRAQDISLYLWANNIVIFCRLAIEAANF